MCRGGARGRSPPDPGSGCSGVPQGWFAQFPALLVPQGLDRAAMALVPLARASVLALGWNRAPSPGSAEKGCLEKPRVYFSSIPRFSLAPGCRGKKLTLELGQFWRFSWWQTCYRGLFCRGYGPLGTNPREYKLTLPWTLLCPCTPS